jgi:hypothetical protein
MSLAKTNKHLRTAEQRATVVERNARASSIFEGASKRALDAVSSAQVGDQEARPKRRRIAAMKTDEGSS